MLEWWGDAEHVQVVGPGAMLILAKMMWTTDIHE